MNTNSKRLGIYLTIMLIATAIATSLRTVACVSYLDYQSGFYSNKALITAADVITILTAIGMLSYALTAKRIKLRASFSTSSTYVPTGILGVATAFLGIRTFTYAISTCKYPFFSVEVFTFKSPSALIGVLTGILALLSIVHHFFNAFLTESKSELRAYFAIASIAFLAFYSILLYLDETVAINDTSKMVREMSFLLAAIFFLYEARISLGREMWRIYTAFGLCAATLAAYASIPAIITYYVKGVVLSATEAKSLASLEEYLLLLALFIFIVARLFLTATLKEEKENELVKALGEYAKSREERVNESYGRFQELFASKQLSIFELYGMDESVAEESEDESAFESTEPEEEKKEIIISDDAIYESIFGRMPERPEPEEPKEAAEEEPEDDRDPEQIAEDILSTMDEILVEGSENTEEETEK